MILIMIMITIITVLQGQIKKIAIRLQHSMKDNEKKVT